MQDFAAVGGSDGSVGLHGSADRHKGHRRDSAIPAASGHDDL